MQYHNAFDEATDATSGRKVNIVCRREVIEAVVYAVAAAAAAAGT